ncbi:MAG: LytR C-terminal domain-containing protein [Candidatus Edwardsbacteria bacterium]
MSSPKNRRRPYYSLPKKKRKGILGRLVFYLLFLFLLVFIFSTVKRFVEIRSTIPREKAEKIRVEVLNGTGVQDIAQRATTYLRQCGFDVVEWGNAENQNFPETVVVDRAEMSASNAKLVARALHCKNVIPQIEHTSLLEVTVVIGKDYAKIFASQKKKCFGIKF